jgi:DNA-binding transcriptional LysR family regulator
LINRILDQQNISKPLPRQTVRQECGQKLFNRTQRAVTLTSAGKAFSEAAEKIVSQYNEAILEAKRLDASQLTESDLAIGFNNLSLGKHSNYVLSPMRSLHPEMNIRLYKSSISDLVNCLYDGRAHIIFSNQFEVRDHSEIQWIPVVETWPGAFLHRSHRLAQKTSLTLTDLEGERLLCAAVHDGHKQLSAAAKVLRDAGVPFTDDSPISGEEAIASMVEAGLGIYPAAVWFRLAFSDDVVCLPLEVDVEHMLIVVAWRNQCFTSLAEELANIARVAIENAVSPQHGSGHPQSSP